MFLPQGVTIPSVDPDNLYFLGGVGHVWQANLQNQTSSVVFDMGGYLYSVLQKKLLEIYPIVDMTKFWSPSFLMDIVYWVSKDPWGLPEIKSKDGRKRIRLT